MLILTFLVSFGIMKKILVPLAIFFAAKWIFGKKNLLNQLNFEIEQIDYEIHLLTTQLYITAILINPTNETLSITNISGTVSLNGTQIGTVNTAQRFTIAPDAKTLVIIKSTISNISTGTAIVTALKNKTGTINFNGTVTTTGVTVPINYDYKIL